MVYLLSYRDYINILSGVIYATFAMLLQTLYSFYLLLLSIFLIFAET